MKLIQADLEGFENIAIKPSDYLIENLESNKWVLHLVIKEEKGAFREDRLLQYEGITYLPNIAYFASEKEAKLAILAAWDAIKQIYT
ncbi:hypothetical protein [Bacillus cereus]|uniref:hypothetical protein n=1 Tax=Bacillus cereus TaxID=1396 RepID=UPI000C28740E|nr:hypothetical protein [Bacillus cereus]